MTVHVIENRVLECLADNYGISGSLKRLAGENLNYLLTTLEGERFVAKIVDDDMPSEVVEMEFEALEHAISAGFSPKLPKIVLNKYRNNETGIIIRVSGEYRLRLIDYIDGITLDKLPDISIYLLKNIGFSMAEYNLAMRDFDHPAASRSHRWNLVEAGQHRDKIQMVDEIEKRALLSWGFDTWQQSESMLKSLPWQFIHGDLNPENILVRDDQVIGLVDFGDSCLNPVICDLAICLSYIMLDPVDPLGSAAAVTRAYQKIRPISEAEFSVLYPLICGRLATTLAISTARRRIDPDNPNWFGDEESTWNLLGALKDMAFSQKPFWNLP